MKAIANFFWPPALYFYGASVWWAVPVGLVAEYCILLPFLRIPPVRVLVVVILSNAGSAISGFVALWPVVFWETGIESVIGGRTVSVLLIVGTLFALNVVVEYWLAVRWLGVPRRRAAVVGFICANAVSFLVLFTAGLSSLKL